MNISLCMITKDEERFLQDCLESVKGYVDEIIIVDTGSSDRTCEIALSYGARVYHRPWQRNFSEARNFGIDRAKGEWILVLDADETLEHGEQMRKLVQAAVEDIDGFLIHILNYSDEMKSQIEKSVNIRLFRNQPHLRFHGLIHEQLPLKDKFVAMTDLSIHHYGYMPSVTAAKEKCKRNLTILQEQLANDPENAFVHYNIGTEYVRLKQYEQAISHYYEALKRNNEETGYESRMYKLLSLCFLQVEVEQRQEFLTIMEQGIDKYADYPDLYYMRALYFEKTGEYARAIADLMRCLVMGRHPIEDHKVYVVEEGATNYNAYYGLGRVFEKMDKKQEALTAYRRSLLSRPLYKVIINKLRSLFADDPSQWLHFLEHKVFGQQENHEERLLYARYFANEGDYDCAFSLLINIKDKTYQDHANYIRGISYYRMHAFAQAVASLSTISKDHPCYMESIPYSVASLWISGETNKVKRLLSRIDSPAQYYRKIVEMLFVDRERMLREGQKKYPQSEGLKKVLASESHTSAS